MTKGVPLTPTSSEYYYITKKSPSLTLILTPCYLMFTILLLWLPCRVEASWPNNNGYDVIPPLRHHHRHQQQHQHSLTDGVDVVTWTIVTSDLTGSSSSPPGLLRRDTDNGDKGKEDPTFLMCNVSSATSHNEGNTSAVTMSDKDTVKLHKNLCISHTRRRRAIVAPGTNWCGAGNVAKNRNDLGAFANVDKCCRDHDHCPLAIEGRSRKFGLYNGGPFTISSCVCDDVFMRCLNSVGTFASHLIGSIFFNILPSRCIQFPNANSNRGDVTLTLRDSRINNVGAMIRDNPPFQMALPNVVETIQQLSQQLLQQVQG